MNPIILKITGDIQGKKESLMIREIYLINIRAQLFLVWAFDRKREVFGVTDRR